MLKAGCNVFSALREARSRRDAGEWKAFVFQNLLPRVKDAGPIGTLLIDKPVVVNRDTGETFDESAAIFSECEILGSRTAAEDEILKTIFRGRRTLMDIKANGAQVIMQRYSDHRSDGSVELPEEVFERVGRCLAKSYVSTVPEDAPDYERDVDFWAIQFTHVMVNKLATPAGRTLANAGLRKIVANCIVRHVEDSLKNILYTQAEAGLLQQDGSGMGFPFHLTRPAGWPVNGHQTAASGPVGWINMYHGTFSEIKQRGRHGANMAVLSVEHPDILEFINCKRREGSVHTFNISVGLTHRFMEDVIAENPGPWMCEFNGESCEARYIKRDAKGHFHSATPSGLTARQIFFKLVDAAHSNGEPGVVFLDEANDRNPVPGLGRIEACNPCGEQFLHDGDVCNLGALNLERFVNEAGELDLCELMRVTDLMVRMLDAVIDESEFSSEFVNKTSRDNRRIGLGFMGLGDALAAMGVGYNTKEGRRLTRAICDAIQAQAHTTSSELAELKGCFPNFHLSVYAEGVPAVSRVVPEGMPRSLKRRNAALTNVAPTGTISLMFGVTNGVEPQYSTAFFYKGVLDQKTAIQCGWAELFKALSYEYSKSTPSAEVYLEFHDLMLRKCKNETLSWSEFKKLKELRYKLSVAYRSDELENLIRRISTEGSIQHMTDLPERIRQVFVVAGDISPKDHIRMQAVAQDRVCNAVSKTINMPNAATRADVYEAYIEGHKKGLKGCTVYRDGSRVFQPLNQGIEEEKEEIFPREEENDFDKHADSSAASSSSTPSAPDSGCSGSEEDEFVLKSSSTEAVLMRAGFTKCPECNEIALRHEGGCDTCTHCSHSACATPLRRSTNGDSYGVPKSLSDMQPVSR